jgi:hypothetical protein
MAEELQADGHRSDGKGSRPWLEKWGIRMENVMVSRDNNTFTALFCIS